MHQINNDTPATYQATTQVVVDLHLATQTAFRVCRGLIEAYQQGEASGGSIDWEDLDQLLPLALEALDKKSLES